MKDTPAEFMKSNDRSGLMTEDQKWESGLFDREAEAELLKDRPDLVEGKKAFEAALLGALNESEDAIDLANSMTRLPAYGVMKFRGVNYIKTPTGENISLQGYLNKLEKSLIEVFRKLADSNKALEEARTELYQLKTKPKGKKNDASITSTSSKAKRQKKAQSKQVV